MNQRTWISGVALAVATTVGAIRPLAASDADRPGHSVEVSWGRIVGPGSSDLHESSRRVAEIDNGERWRFKGRYVLSDRWFIHGEYEASRLSYESPMLPGCPVDALYFLGGFSCQTGLPPPRSGVISDSMRILGVGLGFRQPIGQWLNVIAELGYVDQRWHTRQDVEALAAARCLGIGPFHWIDPDEALRTAVPVDGCVKVRESARRQGLQSALRFVFDLSDTLEAEAFWQVRRGQYTPYRNDLIPRFVTANCSDGCVRAYWIRSNDESATSDWFGARATVRFDRHWVGFLNVETGGSRDWTVIDLGIGYRF